MSRTCFVSLILVMACGCAAASKPSSVAEYVRGLLERRLSGQLKAGEAGRLEHRIARQGIAGVGTIESELLVARDARRGDELYQILGRLGNPSSIPAMLNYYYRREVIDDMDDTDYYDDEYEGSEWRLDTAPVVIKKLSRRQEGWDAGIMVQLRLCYAMYEKSPEVREFILWVGSKIAGVHLGGIGAQATVELMQMGLSSSSRETRFAALELFGNAPTLEAADAAIAFIRRSEDAEMTSHAAGTICCFLPEDGGPYSKFKTDEELDEWLQKELVPWWEANRKFLRLSDDGTCYEMKKQ